TLPLSLSLRTLTFVAPVSRFTVKSPPTITLPSGCKAIARTMPPVISCALNDGSKSAGGVKPRLDRVKTIGTTAQRHKLIRSDTNELGIFLDSGAGWQILRFRILITYKIAKLNAVAAKRLKFFVAVP